jgi:hypothetical protein
MAYELVTQAPKRGVRLPPSVVLPVHGNAMASAALVELIGLQPESRFDLFCDHEAKRLAIVPNPQGRHYATRPSTFAPNLRLSGVVSVLHSVGCAWKSTRQLRVTVEQIDQANAYSFEYGDLFLEGK